MIRFFSLALFLLFASNTIAQQKDLFSKESTAQFANYLYKSGNYKQAAVEYERLILLDSSQADSFKLWALKSYRKADQLNTSLQRIRDWHGVNSLRNVALTESEYKKPIANEYALCLTGLGYYNDALDFLSQNKHLDDNDKNLLSAINYSYLGEWENANKLINDLSTETVAKEILAKAVEKGLNLKLKKPALAAALSIIPGLGRLYTGNYVDAGLSVLTIGTFTWQAYTGFDQNGVRSAYGWITGSVATGFYLGNIYGSYRAAQLINKQKIEAILYEVDRAYGIIA